VSGSLHKALTALVAVAAVGQAAQLPPEVRFIPGPVNGLLLRGKVLVYGDPRGRLKNISHLLFTHARRDVVWAGVPLVAAGAAAIVPERERERFDRADEFWAKYEKARFHDYTQVNTKVLREPLPAARGVREGDVLDLAGVRIEVMETPGYTPGAVTYWMEVGGKRIACTGDLIYGDGQLLDLSSLQDAIPEAMTRGYHGYAARAGALIASLRKVAARKPDVLAPVRGPLIENPQQAIGKLVARLQELMASHFATDALRWYWGEESLRLRSRAVLDGRPVDSMPLAEQRPLPGWVMAIGNSRLLISHSGAGFLIDAGSRALRSKLGELTTSGRLKAIEGIWITHYHDDHTDQAQSLAGEFRCPVYFISRLAGVLEHPSHYRLPALTANPITSGKPQPDGARMRWREFHLTFFDFPGQTLYHGGLLVEREDGEKLFFAGDSFTPSGIDDYCLQNRNFLGEDEGYLYCLRVLERLPRDAWLVNQHVEPTFRFSSEQLAQMRAELRKRRAILTELAPWPSPNYAIDENWAAIHPYASRARPGETVRLRLRIWNHSPRSETYRLKWNVPHGWKVREAASKLTVAPHQEAEAPAALVVGNEPSAAGPLRVVTVDLEFAGRRLREWTEALVRVER
jgi:glyoxylase-like metal-dependent hydrolase (beta-lactamase superfamily II)